MIDLGLNPLPSWIEGYNREPYETSHISGQMRELSDKLWDTGVQEAAIMLAEGADRLDDAHEEWMINQLGLPSASEGQSDE